MGVTRSCKTIFICELAIYNGVISLASVYTRMTSGSRRSVLQWQEEGSGVGEPRKMGCDIYCYDRDNNLDSGLYGTKKMVPME